MQQLWVASTIFDQIARELQGLDRSMWHDCQVIDCKACIDTYGQHVWQQDSTLDCVCYCQLAVSYMLALCAP